MIQNPSVLCMIGSDDVKDIEVHIGDALNVKEWDELLDDGVLDSNDNIIIELPDYTRIRIDKKLKSMCGSQFTVLSSACKGGFTIYYSSENTHYGAIALMLKPSVSSYDVATDEEIATLLR